ncbi:MAG: LuxR C-terminal-related transcriptional regulator [Bacteroidia bacterium]|nr:LuxR C-terminal-related transcriptional regulator [Bacteroidia bacterium]
MKQAYYKYLFLLFVVIFTTLSSCFNPQPEAAQLLEQAEVLMESHPDSAMILIDSIFYPEKSLRKKEYMTYLVARVQARYKNYRPVHEDTLIFAARDYFVSKDKDPHQITMAYFYSGCVYREQGNFEQAMQQYKEAGQYAAKTNNVDLQGLVQYNIGDLLAEEGLHALALEKYKVAESLYCQSPVNPEEKQVKCLIAIGQIFLLLRNNDSALVTFNKGLELAKTFGSTTVHSLLHQNIGVTYKETGNYSEAGYHLHHAFLLENDTTEIPRYYLNFAQLYIETGQTDSVTFYTNRLQESVNTLDDPYFKVSAYTFLAENARKNTNYNTALTYLQQSSNMVEEITEKQLQQSVYEVQQKYNFDKAKERHYHQLSVYKNWGIAFLTLLLTISIIFTFHFIRQKNKFLNMYQIINTLQRMAEELEEESILQGKEITKKQQEIEQLHYQIKNTENNEEYEAVLHQNIHELIALYTNNNRKKSEALRSLLLWQLGVVSKVAALNKMEKDTSSARLFKEFQNVMFKGNFNDSNALIMSVFNRFDNQLALKIQYRIPQLSTQELLVSLLTYAGMSVKEIASLLPVSPHTIQAYRGNLRRYLGITDSSIDTATYLRNLFDE